MASLVKAKFRRGFARIKRGDYEEAKEDLKEAWVMDPQNREVRVALASIRELEVERKAKEKALFANMINGAGGKQAKPLKGVPADAMDISGDGGVWKRIMRSGDVAKGTPAPNSEVQIHYEATLLADGTRLPSSRDRPGDDGPEPPPYAFYLGISAQTKRVVRAWDWVVATMHKGEVAEVYCRSDYAYGPAGHKPDVPADANIKYVIELVECTDR